MNFSSASSSSRALAVQSKMWPSISDSRFDLAPEAAVSKLSGNQLRQRSLNKEIETSNREEKCRAMTSVTLRTTFEIMPGREQTGAESGE